MRGFHENDPRNTRKTQKNKKNLCNLRNLWFLFFIRLRVWLRHHEELPWNFLDLH